MKKILDFFENKTGDGEGGFKPICGGDAPIKLETQPPAKEKSAINWVAKGGMKLIF